MIRAVAWDLGNVLAAFSHQRACEQIAALTGGRHSAEEVRQWIFPSGRHAELEEGRLAPETFLAALASRFEVEAPGETLARAYSDIFVPRPAVAALVGRLRTDLPLLLASNTDPLHWAGCRPLLAPLLARFRDCVLSFEVGARKPSAAFFGALLARAGCRPGELLFTDDLPANVEGARAAGIDAVVFESAAALERELARRGIVPRQGGS
jgi:putative hydrolase of the HAD superfamily